MLLNYTFGKIRLANDLDDTLVSYQGLAVLIVGQEELKYKIYILPDLRETTLIDISDIKICKNQLNAEICIELNYILQEFLLRYLNEKSRDEEIFNTFASIVEEAYATDPDVETIFVRLNLMRKQLHLPLHIRSESFASFNPYCQRPTEYLTLHQRLVNSIDHKSFGSERKRMTLYVAVKSHEAYDLYFYLGLEKKLNNSYDPDLLPSGKKLVRITSDVIVRSMETSETRSIAFTDIQPFDYTNTRLLLFVTAFKNGKLTDDKKVAVDSSKHFRRCHGHGVIDVTWDLMPLLKLDKSDFDREYLDKSYKLLDETPLHWNDIKKRINLTSYVDGTQTDMNVKIIAEAQSLHGNSRVVSRGPSEIDFGSTQMLNSENIEVEFPDIHYLHLEYKEITNYCLEKILKDKLIIERCFGTFEMNCDKDESENDRNELIINLSGGSFQRNHKKQECNVEVEISLRNSNGELVKWRDEFGKETFCFDRTCVIYHSNSPKWNHYIRIALPSNAIIPHSSNSSEEFTDSDDLLSTKSETNWDAKGIHLKFVCYHHSTRMISNNKCLGVSYLPLFNSTFDRCMVTNKTYNLQILKFNENNTDYLNEDPIIKNEVWGSNDSVIGVIFKMKSNNQPDILRINTQLTSSCFPRNSTIVSILYWKRNLNCLKKSVEQCIIDSSLSSEIALFGVPLACALLKVIMFYNRAEATSAEMRKICTNGLAKVFVLAKMRREINMLNYLNREETDGLVFEFHNLHFCIIDQLNSIIDTKIDDFNRQSFLDIVKRIKFFSRIIKSSYVNFVERNAKNQAVVAKETEMLSEHVDRFLKMLFQKTRDHSKEIHAPSIFRYIGDMFGELSDIVSKKMLADNINQFLKSSLIDAGESPMYLIEGIMDSSLFSDVESRKLMALRLADNIKFHYYNRLTKMIEDSKSNADKMLEVWSSLLMKFIDKYIKESFNDKSNNEEFNWIFIENEMLVWLMKRLCTIMISINDKDQNYTGLYPKDYYKFQPYMEYLTACILTVLQNMQRSDWIDIAGPKAADDEVYSDNPPSFIMCQCNNCQRNGMIGSYDFVHELLNIFKTWHKLASFPCLPPSKDLLIREENEYSDLAKGEVNLKFYHQPWPEMLALQSFIEFRALDILYHLILKPFYLTHAGQDWERAKDKPCTRCDDEFSRELVVLWLDCLKSYAVDHPHLNYENSSGGMESISVIRTPKKNSDEGNKYSEEYLGDGSELGDLRAEASRLTAEIWNSIDPNFRSIFIPQFIETAVVLGTVPLQGVRKQCVSLIISAISIDRRLVSTHLISEIDRVLQWTNRSYAQDFIKYLTEGLENYKISPVSPFLSDSTEKSIVDTVKKQINCLLDLTDYIGRGSQIQDFLALSNVRFFYEANGRPDIAVRYLFRLERVLENFNKVVERAHTLLKINDCYEWSDEVKSFNEVSKGIRRKKISTATQLKEELLLMSKGLFEKSLHWEKAIEVGEALVNLYLNVKPNFQKLSLLHNSISSLYAKISSEIRSEVVNYYLIEFFGNNYPSFVPKSLIFRTNEQRLDLKIRIQSEFEDISVTLSRPTDASQDKVIYISQTLTAEPEPPSNLNQQGVPNILISHYYKNYVQKFQLRSVICDQDGQVSIEKTYSIDEHLPTLIPFAKVSNIAERTLTPIQTATIDINKMSLKLQEEMDKVIYKKTKDVKMMVGALSSSIQSNVSGGLDIILAEIDRNNDTYEALEMTDLKEAMTNLLYRQNMGLKLWARNDNTQKDFLQVQVEQFDTLRLKVESKMGLKLDELASVVDINQELSQIYKSEISLNNDSKIFKRAKGTIADETDRKSYKQVLFVKRQVCENQLPVQCRATNKRDPVSRKTESDNFEEPRFSTLPTSYDPFDSLRKPSFFSKLNSITSEEACESPPVPNRDKKRRSILSASQFTKDDDIE